jgi:hypothetical protein
MVQNIHISAIKIHAYLFTQHTSNLLHVSSVTVQTFSSVFAPSVTAVQTRCFAVNIAHAGAPLSL